MEFLGGDEQDGAAHLSVDLLDDVTEAKGDLRDSFEEGSRIPRAVEVEYLSGGWVGQGTLAGAGVALRLSEIS